MKPINDTLLLERLKKSEYSAFNSIYDMYWEKLYIFCFKLTSDKELTEEVLQVIFVQLWEKREVIEISNLKSYLFQSVKFQFFNLYKKNKVYLDPINKDIEDYLISNLDEEHPEILDVLAQALDQLPEKRKEILLMSKYQNMSANEISLTLNISPQTVRNQVSMGLSQLRDIMKVIKFFLIYIKLTFW